MPEFTIALAIGLLIGFILGYGVRAIISYRRHQRAAQDGDRTSLRSDGTSRGRTGDCGDLAVRRATLARLPPQKVMRAADGHGYAQPRGTIPP